MKCNTCGTDNVEGARFCANCGAIVAEPVAPGAGLVGQVVGGRYHVKRILGEGGMGVVYEAEQPMGTATRKVALKTLHAHLSHDPSVSQRFHRECGTISQLEHPNTIKVYDFGATTDGTLYIAMEFVAGRSLSQVIEEAKQLPPERVLKIMRQICGSLEEAHQQGVIHRDLKPDNVVLTDRAGEKDVVKLLDFGIAARTESADAQREQKLTQQGMVLGTPPYMSPEQFTGKALDARSDVYSLGVLTYEMLTGRLPFDADTPWQWATEHMTSQPRPFEATPVSSSIPPSMRAAVLRSLSKNREERQSSAKQFIDELSGEGVPAGTGSGSGTAAMAQPPVFGGAANAVPKTAAMPAGGSSPVAPAMPTAVSAPRPGGGKGLVYGLAGVGGLLLVAIVIVAVRSMKPEPETPIIPPTPPPPATVAAIPPPTDDTPPPAPTPTPPPPDEPTPTPAKPTGSGGAAATTTPSAGGAAATPTPPTPPTPPQPTQPKPPPQQPAPSTAGCAQCSSLAASGNITGAAAAFRNCTDPGQQSACAAIVKSRAPAAAEAAAFNGNCSLAKSIVAAGVSMGVPSGNRQFRNAKKQCP